MIILHTFNFNRHNQFVRAGIFLLFFLLLGRISKAQSQSDTLKTSQKTDSVLFDNPLDSIAFDSVSLLNQVDSIKGMTSKMVLSGSKDLSLKKKKLQKIQSLSDSQGDSLYSFFKWPTRSPKDTIGSLNPLGSLDSIAIDQDFIQNITDSINFNPKDDLFEKKLDEINAWSADRNIINDTLSNKVTSQFLNSDIKVNVDLTDRLNPNTNLDIDTPEFEIGEMPQFKNDNSEFPDLINSDNDLPDITGFDTSQLLDIQKKVPELDLPDLDNPLEGYKEKAMGEVGKVKGFDQIKNGEAKIEELNELSTDVTQYKEQIKEGYTEKIEEELNSQLKISKELNSVKKEEAALLAEKQALEEQLKMMREMQDKEVLREQLKQKVKDRSPNYFNGHQNELLAAHQQMSNYKQKYQQVSDVQALAIGDIKGKRINRFPGMLLIGSDFEIIKDSITSIDISPFLGIEFSDKWHVKVNYLWRFNSSLSKNQFEFHYGNVKGWATSLNYKIRKGFIATGGFEKRLSKIPGDSKVGSFFHSEALIAGLRKTYKIINGLHGDAQVLYHFNLTDFKVYKSNLHLRIGLFLDLAPPKLK